VEEQLLREPFPFPELVLNKDVKTLSDLENLEWADFELKNYVSHARIGAPVAV
jgi:thymidylate synthase